MEIRLIKVDGGLMPFDDEAREVIKRWKPNVMLNAEVKQPRNYEHHKKIFALFNLVLTQTEEFQSINEVLEFFKIKAGRYKIIKVGETHYPITQSISFSSMTQDEFNLFYDKSIDIALLLIPVEKEELATMIAQF